MADFVTDRNLLNPKFEGYKLSPISQDEHVFHFPLRTRFSQANVSGRTRLPLSFQEVQNRIKHNHLYVSFDGSYVLYIDEQFQVISVRLNAVSQPTFETLLELPRPLQSPEQAAEIHVEYPSAVSFAPDAWLISDGYGTLYVLRKLETDFVVTARYCLPNQNEFSQTTPFKIHAAKSISTDVVTCVLSCRQIQTGEGISHDKPQFSLLLASISLYSQSELPVTMNLPWQGYGEDIPTYVSYDELKNAFYILGNTVYRRKDAPTPPFYEPTPDEIVPIPRATESESSIVLPSKPPPYSWTQSHDSVTIAFPVPSNVPKSAIHVTITAQTLSILIKHDGRTLIDLPRYSLKQFWDSVRPSTSFWTWDKEGEREFGLLTIHLDKQHEGTKWMHVFSSVGRRPASEVTDPSDVEVPETLDPSELWKIREMLEKYTSTIRDGEDASGLGLGHGVPSLAEGELDESVDTNVGMRIWLTWIKGDGGDASWDINEGVPSVLLSTPLPGVRENSLVIRNDIDGLLFTSPTDGRSTTWKHTSTYPALAFVLASKRDTRFTYHVNSKLVLACESGTGVGGGNMYIYRGSPEKQTWAKQHIFRVSGGSVGALSGVACVRIGGSEEPAIVCLCEEEMIVVKSEGWLQ